MWASFAVSIDLLIQDNSDLTMEARLEWRSCYNFSVIEVSNFYLGMWGSFGVSVDLPKLEDSHLTMEASLKCDPEMEVIPKLLCY